MIIRNISFWSPLEIRLKYFSENDLKTLKSRGKTVQFIHNISLPNREAEYIIPNEFENYVPPFLTFSFVFNI